MIKLAGLFNGDINAVVEMLYQHKYDYQFDSSKFAHKFPEFDITPYDEGILETANAYRKLKDNQNLEQ